MEPSSILVTCPYSGKNRLIRGIKTVMNKSLQRIGTAIAIFSTLAPAALFGAQLSSDGKSSIPKDVQQVIVVDYRAMQNSPAAMELKDRVLPPELKRLETALKTSGLKVDQDADTLGFALFRTGAGPDTARIV